MRTFTVDLYKEFEINRPTIGNPQGVLECELYEDKAKRPAALICPGGGYQMVSMDREGFPIASRFSARGCNTFILNYTTNAPYPTQLIELAMASIWIHRHAKEYRVQKMFSIGFSAGAHLSLSGALTYTDPAVKDIFGNESRYLRPDAVVACYPVVTMGITTHAGSRTTLCAGDKTVEKKMSLERRVKKNSPPAFIWTTANDGCVPAINSLLLAEAYAKKKLPYALRIFRAGVHGSATADAETCNEYVLSTISADVVNWLDSASLFLREIGFGIH